jgi:cytochrome c biogenesis protein CcmG, thiol:disulfide interchange protein DsbE
MAPDDSSASPDPREVFADPPPDSGLTSLVGTSGKPMTLADTEDDLLVHGRIGYGTRTPWLLGGLLVFVVLLLGGYSLLRAGNDEPAGPDAAPDFELTLFDGTTFRLSDHRGKVVVVNFWASWCEPCRDEMPALQQAATRAGDDVVFVGVAAKNDSAAEAQGFAADYGVTYPVGQDTGGDNRAIGPIQLSYNVIGFPATFVIDPEGNVDSLMMGPIADLADIDALIDNARD